MTQAPQDFWFLNTLVTFVTTTADTEGAFFIYHQVAPSGFATPLHTHAAYGEGFYVLEGEVTFFHGEKKQFSARTASSSSREPRPTDSASAATPPQP